MLSSTTGPPQSTRQPAHIPQDVGRAGVSLSQVRNADQAAAMGRQRSSRRTWGSDDVKNSVFVGNYSDHFRGAIYNLGDTVNVTNCEFSTNRGWGWFGGGIVSWRSTAVNIKNSSFSGNLGGAIAAWGDINIDNSEFLDNWSGALLGGGGAIISFGALTVSDSNVLWEFCLHLRRCHLRARNAHRCQ
jgi:hypothetical protein